MGKGLEQSPQCLRKLLSHPSVIFGVGLQQFLKKLSAQRKGKFDQLSAMFAQDSGLLSKPCLLRQTSDVYKTTALMGRKAFGAQAETCMAYRLFCDLF